jgi:hypothetical protein
MTETQKSALDMTDEEWRAARALAAAGKPPVAAAAAAPPPPIEDTPTAEPPPITSTSNTTPVPPPAAIRDRGVLDLTESEYRTARETLLRQSEGSGRVSLVTYAKFSR